MNKQYKPVPREWQLVMDEDTIARAISRMSFEIVEKDRDLKNLAIVGIRTGGEYLGKRLQEEIQRIEKIEVAYGVIDITLYRDDLSSTQSQPTLRGTDLPFRIAGSRIVLVDDVLFTGRTIRSALDAIIDGRAALSWRRSSTGGTASFLSKPIMSEGWFRVSVRSLCACA